MTLDRNISNLWQEHAGAFSPKGRYRVAYVEPPPDLAPLITTFYIYRSKGATQVGAGRQ